jgi:hypothetical protein
VGECGLDSKGQWWEVVVMRMSTWVSFSLVYFLGVQ